jgi:hypothetical protein
MTMHNHSGLSELCGQINGYFEQQLEVKDTLQMKHQAPIGPVLRITTLEQCQVLSDQKMDSLRPSFSLLFSRSTHRVYRSDCFTPESVIIRSDN